MYKLVSNHYPGSVVLELQRLFTTQSYKLAMSGSRAQYYDRGYPKIFREAYALLKKYKLETCRPEDVSRLFNQGLKSLKSTQLSRVKQQLFKMWSFYSQAVAQSSDVEGPLVAHCDVNVLSSHVQEREQILEESTLLACLNPVKEQKYAVVHLNTDGYTVIKEFDDTEIAQFTPEAIVKEKECFGGESRVVGHTFEHMRSYNAPLTNTLMDTFKALFPDVDESCMRVSVIIATEPKSEQLWHCDWYDLIGNPALQEEFNAYLVTFGGWTRDGKQITTEYFDVKDVSLVTPTKKVPFQVLHDILLQSGLQDPLDEGSGKVERAEVSSACIGSEVADSGHCGGGVPERLIRFLPGEKLVQLKGNTIHRGPSIFNGVSPRYLFTVDIFPSAELANRVHPSVPFNLVKSSSLVP